MGKLPGHIQIISVLVYLAVTAVPFASAAEGKTRYRSGVLNELARVETAFNQSSKDMTLRREYATLLFQTGDFWKAEAIISPLLNKSSRDVEALSLGARLAYMSAGYQNAEGLYKRVIGLAERGSKESRDAAKGLALTYFQTREYTKVKGLPDIEDFKPTMDMMRKFPGKPYVIGWNSKEKVTIVPYTIETMLPAIQVRVNGKELEFILDTGGNLLYIDKAIAEEIGIEKLATQKATYAYTGGEEVEEYLGRAQMVTLGGVTIKNVSFTLAEWKSRGMKSDGVLSTQALREFLFTIDYINQRMIFREKSGSGMKQFKASIAGKETVEIPFVLDSTHLMFARGSLNGTAGLTFFVDSGLAASMPFIGMDSMLEDMKIETTKIEGTKYRWFPIRSLGLGSLMLDAPTQGLAGVMVGEDPYWRRGFIWDGLISHQFLKNFSSWTIDFLAMKFIFVK